MWLQRACLLEPVLCDQAGAIMAWLEGVRGTCNLCVEPQVPLALQPTADLGGTLTEQSLAGKELVVRVPPFPDTLLFGSALLAHQSLS